jgi:Zn-dependent peptidase ImmA (M78 family)
MPLYRGFKTYASAVAMEFRQELNLAVLDPFDPLVAAQFLGIEVITFSDLRGECDPRAISRLRSRSTVSAFTFFVGNARIIVHNDRHSPARARSDLSHELSHALLRHPPHIALDERGCRLVHRDYEDEAAWLSSILLLPDAAAIAMVRSQMDHTDAAARYGVSMRMLQFRLNMSGAYRRVQPAPRAAYRTRRTISNR